MSLTPEVIQQLITTGDPETLQLIQKYLDTPLLYWTPRPDQPTKFDQQAGFVNDTARNVVALGGTGSGKSDAAAYKVSKYLLQDHAPPRPDTPFWVICQTYEVTGGVLWGEKLKRFIPPEAINGSPSWLDVKKQWPKMVRLKPWANGNSWNIEFKSAAQGRERLQAASIGGAWVSESISDWGIIEEVQGRLRDYGWAQLIWDLTPLIPMPRLESLYDNPPDSWKFYHLNSQCNTALATGWVDEFLEGLSEDIRETRRIGKFGSYEGVIFKEFCAANVVEPFDIPEDWPRYRALDFGNNFACIWIAKDTANERYYVYSDYYWDYASKRSSKLLRDHADNINSVQWDLPSCMSTFGDPADPTSMRELGQYGVHCTGARKAVLESIETVRKLLSPQKDGKPGLYFFDTCGDTINQMKAYRWATAHGVKDPKPEPLKHWDHLVDCIRMGILSIPKAVVPIKPLNKLERTWGSKPTTAFKPLNIKKRR